MKYGRLAAKRPVGLRDFAAYLTDPLPAPPASVAAPTVADWGMLGNDSVGDCTLAGLVHLRMANAAEHSETETWPSADAVVATYFSLSGGQDSGLNEADVLQAWNTRGLFGDVLPGYAPLDHRDHDELCSVVAEFGGSYLGVAVPAPAQRQFAAGEPWDLTHTWDDEVIMGGHAVPVVGYDQDHVYVVTWGKLQPATWDWVAAYLEEAWALLTTESDRVDHDALTRDLQRIQQA